MSSDDLRQRAQVKSELRKRIGPIRRALPASARETRARAACEQLMGVAEWKAARSVLAYSPIEGELDPRFAVEAAQADGKEVLLPRVDLQTQRVVMHLWQGEALELGAYGIPEPSAAAPIREEVALVLVPAMVIDPRGHRIGWGKGFYDRLLADEAAKALRVGFIYDFQLLVECPEMPHDLPVHVVVTDTRRFTVGELSNDVPAPAASKPHGDANAPHRVPPRGRRPREHES